MTLTALLLAMEKIEKIAGITVPMVVQIIRAFGIKVTTDTGVELSEEEVVAVISRAGLPWQRIRDRASSD